MKLFLNWVGLIQFLCIWAISPGYAQDPPQWHYWTLANGLAESWSHSIEPGQDGRYWINHGDVPYATLMDRFNIERIPSPGPALELKESPDGAVWSVSSNGLKRFLHNQWETFPIPSENLVRGMDYTNPNRLMPLAALSQEEVLLLSPDRLLRFDTASQSVSVVKSASDTSIGLFHDLIRSRNGGFWVTGNQGVGLVRASNERFDSPVEWTEFLSPNSAWTNFRLPVEDERGRLFFVAYDGDLRRNVLLCLNGTEWSVVYNGPIDVQRGWPGTENDYWIYNEAQGGLFWSQGDRLFPAGDSDILAGHIFDVAYQDKGSFLLATSHGIARYTPAIWETFYSFLGHNYHCHSIHQDTQDRLWFLCRQALLCYQQGQWKEYAYPGGVYSQGYDTNAIGELTDGRLSLRMDQQGSSFLIFDPETETFDSIRHPEDRAIGFMSRRQGRTLWIETLDLSDPGSQRLEIFDGQSFRPLIDQGGDWHIGAIRYVMEGSDGALWIGGTNGLAVYKDNVYRVLSQEPGYPGGGVFSILELRDGQIWIGGSNAVYGYSQGDWIKLCTGTDKVREMIEANDGTVWAAAGRGIYRCKDSVWLSNNTEEGTPSGIAFDVFQDRQDRVWLGTTQGIALFHPEADLEPPDTFADRSENTKEHAPDSEVRLYYRGQDSWNYTRSNRLVYFYRLDGGAWNGPTFRTFLSLGVLPYGDHLFEVRAMDRNFNIDPTPAAYPFKVLLPWHLETGFLTMAALAGLALLFIVGMFVTRNIKLEMLVARRTSDLTEAYNQLQNDMKERKKAEAALRQSEALYQSLVDVLPQCIYRKDLQGRLTFVNSSYCWLMEKTIPEMLGKTDFDLFPTDAAQCQQDDDHQVVTSRKINDRVRHLVLKDGRKIQAQWVKVPVFDSTGMPLGIQGIFWDISERVASEEALRKSQEMLQLVMDNVPQYVFWKDVNSVYLGCNMNSAKGGGLNSPEEIIGKTDYDLPWTIEETEQYRQGDRYVIETDQPLFGIVESQHRPDGTEAWLETNKVPLHDSTGKVVGVLGMFEDITEKRKAELEKVKLEEQLRQAQKMEAVGQLAGGVAHDFNNLLTAIVGYSDLLLLKLQNEPELHKDMLEIKKAGDRAAVLTRQLLAFSRKQVLQPKVVSLNSIVADILGMLQRLVSEHIEFNVVQALNLGNVKADPGQIEQVIVNTVVNARDAMPDGGKLTLETLNLALKSTRKTPHDEIPPGDYVVLRVSDTGMGMDEKVISRIFEPFFTTKEKGKGTGLGLATVYGIVTQSGGYVAVESQPNQGTTFEILLPLIRESQESRDDSLAGGYSLQGTETILLVEDDPAVRTLAYTILTRHGYTVLQASQGGQALLLSEKFPDPIHLLLSDIIMPQMGGRELASKVRMQRPDVKVLYISGYANDMTLGEEFRDRHTDFLQKPFSSEVLARKVRDMLDEGEGELEK